LVAGFWLTVTELVIQRMVAEKEKIEREGFTEEIALHAGITAGFASGRLTLKGSKGEAGRNISEPGITVRVEDSKVIISSLKGNKTEKKIVGSLRAHVVNLLKGVTDGHVYRLKVCYTHFPINVSVAGRKLIVKNLLGEKIPRVLELAENVKVKVEGAEVFVESPSKEAAGLVAGSIERLTKRSSYDTRVFADGIYITHKDGREMK